MLAALVLAGCGAGEDEPAAPTGPLTVEQALALDSDEPVTVRGSLLVDAAGETRLCAALAESYPPQCGGPSLVVEGLAPHALPPLRRAQDVAWSERPVDLRGMVFDGSLRVLERGG